MTREYERIIKVPNGKKTIEHKIQQQVVEIKANIIRVLDRSSNTESDGSVLAVMGALEVRRNQKLINQKPSPNRGLDL